MLTFSPKTLLLAVAALPCLIHGTHGTPTGLRARDSEHVLFKEGGPSLDDIVIHSDKVTERSKEGTIFAHALIALRKIGPENINLWVEGYDGVSKENKDETTVVPYYMDTKDHLSETTIKVSFDEAEKAAEEHKSVFGFTDDAPWWPYAMFSGALQAGWSKTSSGEDIPAGPDLAKQALSLLSGYEAVTRGREEFEEFKEQDLYAFLQHADNSPFILEIAEFNTTAHPGLEGKRWEKWVTVMSFDLNTKKLDYATSFYDGEEAGITIQDIDIDSMEILSVAYLKGSKYLTGERVRYAAGSAPTGLIVDSEKLA